MGRGSSPALLPPCDLPAPRVDETHGEYAWRVHLLLTERAVAQGKIAVVEHPDDERIARLLGVAPVASAGVRRPR
jgi:hypothetical protein